jgi:hypothetical protein
MSIALENYAAASKIERTLALRRAEHRAPLIEAAKQGTAARPSHPPRGTRLRRLAIVGALALGLTIPAVAAAHPHNVTTGNGEEQVIAHGQNHAAPDPADSGTMCGGDPAGYGLETAHHGPDAGTPGKADDGCYQTTGNVPPGQDVENPAIH